MCPPPPVRKCISRKTDNFLGFDERSSLLTSEKALLAAMQRNVRYEGFSLIDNFEEAPLASREGSLPLKFTPEINKAWGARVWEVEHMSIHYKQQLVELEKYIPLRSDDKLPVGMRRIRLVLDVGGGSGRFASSLRENYGITCITTTRDNHLVNGKFFFDLPFYEMIVEDGLPAILWSGMERMPVPDNSFDWINSEYALQNFSEDEEAEHAGRTITKEAS